MNPGSFSSSPSSSTNNAEEEVVEKKKGNRGGWPGGPKKNRKKREIVEFHQPARNKKGNETKAVEAMSTIKKKVGLVAMLRRMMMVAAGVGWIRITSTSNGLLLLLLRIRLTGMKLAGR
jgi:hypothetical protein